MRSAWFVVWLAWRRLRRRDSGAVHTALGLAAAAVVLAGVQVGVTIASDRSASQAVERISAAARAVRAAWFGVPAAADEEYAVLNRRVRESLTDLPLAGPTPLVLVRESTIAGRFVGVAGVDGLGNHVILRSGRLPRSCIPTRCEVLRLRGKGLLPNALGLRLVQVGTATLRSQQIFGDFIEPIDSASEAASAVRESGRYHEPPPAPLVVAEGVANLAASPALARAYRSYAWVWPLGSGNPRLWQFDDVLGAVERARSALALDSGAFSVGAPDQELRAAQRAATVSGRRLLLVGGEVAALLLAFAVLAARSTRRDFEGARRRLTWYGASRWQLWLLVGIESSAVAIAGVLVGWTVGAGAGAAVAKFAGAPPAAVLVESILSPAGLGLAAVAILVTSGVVAGVAWARPQEHAFGPVEFIACAALLTVVVALLAGVADPDSLASGERSALLLLLIPALVALSAAILVARVFPWLAGWVASRARGIAARLAAVGLVRGSGAAVVTVAFLTIAFALALLAEGYRATLSRSEREQAAFAVPLDITVREDLRSLVPVFDAAPLDRFRELAGERGAAYPVLRVTGGASRAEQVSGVTVLGLDGAAIEKLGVWRPEWGEDKSRTRLAELIDPGGEVELRGVSLARNELAVRVGPSLLALAAVVETRSGAFRRVELGEADSTRSRTLRANVPRASKLVSLQLLPPPRIIEGGANAGHAVTGSVCLSGSLANELSNWVGFDGVEVRPAPGGVELRYVLTPQRNARVRAPQATDGSPPRVLATPRLAELAGGVGGALALQVGGGRVPVRVAAVVTRFPSGSGELVVGDRRALRTAVNAVAAGAARDNEVWLDVPEARVSVVSAALSRAPFRALSTTTRAELEEDARQDPLARGTLLALSSAAVIALLLAAVGLALAVRSDLRDERGELYDLEAQGASPVLLRRVVRVRALVLAVGGLGAGVIVGLALISLVTRVVSVTARGGAAEPPLAATLDPLVVVAGALCFVVLAVLLVLGATREAFAGVRAPAFRDME
jgi:hypothetical protein